MTRLRAAICSAMTNGLATLDDHGGSPALHAFGADAGGGGGGGALRRPTGWALRRAGAGGSAVRKDTVLSIIVCVPLCLSSVSVCMCS